MGAVVIDALTDTIAHARGKPVDVNVMIFAFTHQAMGDRLLDIGKTHPNVTLRFIADATQLTNDGQHQLPRLLDEAARLELTNLDVRFKKDAPDVYDAARDHAEYSRRESSGLHHHKGLVTLIDGRPHQLVTGSFNWSETADDENDENLVVLDGKDAGDRGVMAQDQAEFVAFFNHADPLDAAQAKAWKRFVLDQVRTDKLPASQALRSHERPDLSALASPPYTPRAPGAAFDINALLDEAFGKLRAAVGGAIVKELANGSRFASFDEPIERVRPARRADVDKLHRLADIVEFGSVLVPIDGATQDDLVCAFKGLVLELQAKTMATSILALRRSIGDIDGVGALRTPPGFSSLSEAMFARIPERLNDDVGRAFFSSRSDSDVSAGTPAGTGHTPENANAVVPVLGPDGTVSEQKATLSAGVVDCLRRIPAGHTVRVAMVGLSENTPKFTEMVAAARRGVPFQVVLNDDNNAAILVAFQRHIAAGLPFEVRIQRAKTMHAKFGVSGDDSFPGSANFSGSSSSTNSEDRFVFKNNPKVAAALNDDFALIWNKSRPPRSAPMRRDRVD